MIARSQSRQSKLGCLGGVLNFSREAVRFGSHEYWHTTRRELSGRVMLRWKGDRGACTLFGETAHFRGSWAQIP